MAKIRPNDPDTNLYLPYYYHCGGTLREPGHPWHGIYACHDDDFPTFIARDLNTYLPTLGQAMIAARDFVALPQLARDICWQCWDFDIFMMFTARSPRWNIYRGQTRMLIPPTILWDWNNLDPPPGFQWDGT
jgi:hypothetical protein